VYQVLKKIKNQPYFKWPTKMGGDPSKRNQSLLPVPPGMRAHY